MVVIPDAPVAFHLSLFARSCRFTRNSGNVAVGPSHGSSHGFEIVEWASMPAFVETSNAFVEAKMSRMGTCTLGAAGAAMVATALVSA